LVLLLLLGASYSAQIQNQERGTFVDKACVFNECLLHYNGPFYEDYMPADEFVNFTLYCISGTDPGELWTQSYNFSASQSNLVAYTAITSMNFDFNAVNVYADLEGTQILVDSGEDIRRKFVEEAGSTWTPEDVAHLWHVIPIQTEDAKVVWHFAPRSRNERFCLRTIDVVPEAVTDGF
ncbi:hypothetical protein AAVH_29523, partial [Aphelenchoides avenae]